MKRRIPLLLCLCLGLPIASGFSAYGAEGSGLAGKWTLDIAQSTPIKPWDYEALTITVEGDHVAIARDLSWGGDRKVTDLTNVTADGKTVTVNPVKYWLDTWYTNVYIGGDHAKHVRAQWLDAGRILELETKLTLEAQQGDHPVHIHSEYRLSADGRTLKLFELRSSRDQPLVYVFTRA